MDREAPKASSQTGAGDAAAPRRATLSDVIMEFAAPLLALDPTAAAEPDVLRQLMVLVDMCWNLPSLEGTDPGAYATLKQGFEAVVREVPAPMAEQLNELIAARKTRFAAVPFLVHTRVEEDAAGKARIITEARKLA